MVRRRGTLAQGTPWAGARPGPLYAVQGVKAEALCALGGVQVLDGFIVDAIAWPGAEVAFREPCEACLGGNCSARRGVLLMLVVGVPCRWCREAWAGLGPVVLSGGLRVPGIVRGHAAPADARTGWEAHKLPGEALAKGKDEVIRMHAGWSAMGQ